MARIYDLPSLSHDHKPMITSKPPEVDLKPIQEEIDRLRHEIHTLKFSVNNQTLIVTELLNKILNKIKKL